MNICTLKLCYAFLCRCVAAMPIDRRWNFDPSRRYGCVDYQETFEDVVFLFRIVRLNVVFGVVFHRCE